MDFHLSQQAKRKYNCIHIKANIWFKLHFQKQKCELKNRTQFLFIYEDKSVYQWSNNGYFSHQPQQDSNCDYRDQSWLTMLTTWAASNKIIKGWISVRQKLSKIGKTRKVGGTKLIEARLTFLSDWLNNNIRCGAKLTAAAEIIITTDIEKKWRGFNISLFFVRGVVVWKLSYENGAFKISTKSNFFTIAYSHVAQN